MKLAIDACTKSASCAVFRDESIVSSFTIESGLAHSVNLLPLIDDALKYSSAKVGDLKEIFVSNGPGSFTGIRIALSLAKGLAHSLNIPITPVSTLKALSFRAASFKGLICPIMDARRNRIYAAAYEGFGGDVIVEEAQLELIAFLDGVEAYLKKTGREKATFVGDGVPVYLDKIRERLGEACLTVPCTHLSSAEGVYYAAKAYNISPLSYVDIDAVYLRLPQAERERLGGRD